MRQFTICEWVIALMVVAVMSSLIVSLCYTIKTNTLKGMTDNYMGVQ